MYEYDSQGLALIQQAKILGEKQNAYPPKKSTVTQI